MIKKFYKVMVLLVLMVVFVVGNIMLVYMYVVESIVK